jgi:putative transposase
LSARLRAPPSAPLRPGHAAQDTWADFARWCRTHQVRTSVGRTGVCWDSAAAESFFATLKNEMYYRHTWPPRTRARFAVAEYIEVFYHQHGGGGGPGRARSPRHAGR